MKKEIIIPQMGESITEAEVGQIFKPSGTFVNQDDEILELETDKVNQVIYAPKSGLVELSVKPHDKVKVGEIIGSIDTSKAPVEIEEVEKMPLPEIKTVVRTGEVARESKADYLDALKQGETASSNPFPVRPSSTPLEGETRKPMSRLRQTIANRLVQAKSETAMLTTFNEVDLTEVINLREKYKESFQKKYGLKMGFMPFFVLATLAALKEYPILNAHIEGDEIVEKGSVNMGIAVSTDRGLIVPVIKDVSRLSFPEIEGVLAKLAEKGREGKLTVDEIRGGTFTITNGGAFGSLLSTPILNFPQSGILGMHAIQKRPVVIDDEIKIRSMMYLALSYDHRLVDGREAVLFLKHIKGLLDEPGRFVIGI